MLVYFDATDPDAPLWRFVFQPEMDARDALGQTQYDLRYRVEIASPAGDVASAGGRSSGRSRSMIFRI